MCNVKGSAALVVAAAAMIMFLTGCETTKHAEVMSAEELAARGQVVAERPEATPAEPSGIPLREPGISQEPLDIGERIVPGMPSDIEPESPPSVTLREREVAALAQPEGETIVDAGIGEVGEGPAPAEIPTDYPVGQRSPAAMFDTELPPQPYLGAREELMGEVAEAPVTPEEVTEAPVTPEIVEPQVEAGPSGYEGEQFVRALTPSDFVPEGPPQPFLGDGGLPIDSGMEAGATPGAGEEVVRLPDQDTIEPLSQGELEGAQEDSRVSGVGLGHVYFDFDKYFIRDDAVPTLQANVQLLKAKHKSSSVLIEGHCDERGTSEYNLVLGERRAKAVKNYLIDLGVSSSRIQIVSYGKERPSCTESEESCWQQNRRGHFVLQ